MLERAYHFLTTRTRPEIEAAADAFFPAIGYRRAPHPPGTEHAAKLAFERGRRFASFWSPSLRACETVVTVEVGEGSAREVPRRVQVRHAVRTIGRLVIAEDGAIVEAESRAFERFVENGEPDLAALLAAASRRRRRALAAKLLGLAAFAAACALAVLRFRGWI
jgi:hypothetical protein